jgi:multiple sugar transport system substrate-binding protein
MKKRIIIAILLECALVMSIFAGCGGTSASGGTSAAANKATADGKTEISFWDNYADKTHTEIYNTMIKEFEQENPQITVKYVPLPSDQAKSKYDVAIQSKTTPDCGVIYQYWMNDFAVEKGLLPLDDYISTWNKKDEMIDIFQNSIKNTSLDGKTYSIAQYAVIPTLWYNKQVFKKSGLPAPTTWDEVFADVAKTTDKKNGVYGFSIRGGAGSSQQVEQMLYQYSGITDMFDKSGKSTINDPSHVEYLDKLAKLYNKYTPESDITNASTEMISAFDSGTAAMIFHNIGSYGQHRDTLGNDNFGAAVSLKSKQNTNVLVSNGVICLSVFNNSKHPKEAFKFISFLAEHKADSQLNEKLGSVPCNKEALKDDWVQKSLPVKEAAAMLLNKDTKLATLPFNVTGYFDLHQNTLAKDFQNVLLGNETAKQYLDRWADQMTQLKKQYDDKVVKK